MSADKYDIQVQVFRQNLEDQYTIQPNDLMRGTGIYAGMPNDERILLGAGLSCKDGWMTDLSTIESWLLGPNGEPLGRDRQRECRRGLRERGFLKMVKSQLPAGSAGGTGGRIRWKFAFFMTPLPVEQRDELPPKTRAGRQKAPKGTKAAPVKVAAPAKVAAPKAGEETAGGTMPGISGHGRGAEETAGGTMPGKPGPGAPGHGAPGHGAPGPETQGAVPYIEKNYVEKNYPPTNPSEQRVSAAPDTSVGGMEGASAETETPDDADLAAQSVLSAVVADCAEHVVPATVKQQAALAKRISAAIRRGWHPDDIRRLLSGNWATAKYANGTLGVRLAEHIEAGSPPTRPRVLPRQQNSAIRCVEPDEEPVTEMSPRAISVLQWREEMKQQREREQRERERENVPTTMADA